MIESKNIILYDIKEFLHEIFKHDSKQKSQLKYLHIPLTRDDSDFNLIKKKRALKKWKESINNYYLNPEKFKFGFKDLK